MIYDASGYFDPLAAVCEIDRKAGAIRNIDSGTILRFTVDNGLLRRHPTTMGRDSTERVRAVASAVGTSLGVASDSHKLLFLGATAYDILDSGDIVSAAGRAQAVAVPFGTGRVVVIGDGSILSGIPYGVENPQFRRWWPRDPDNGQFTLNVTRWLAGVLAENAQFSSDARS